MAGILGATAAGAARRPWAVLAALAVLVAVSVWAATGLTVQPVEDAFFDRDAPAWQETERTAAEFGSDPVVILADGPLDELLEADNLGRITRLENCVAGRLKEETGSFGRICGKLARLDPVAVAAGPGTFLTRAVDGILKVYREQIRKFTTTPVTPAEAAERQEQLKLGAEVISRYGLSPLSPPSIEDRDFINRVVFGANGTRSGPKPRLAYLFPSPDAAQVVLRLRDGLAAGERSEAVDLVRRAAAEPEVALNKVSYVVSGSPVVFDGLGSSLRVEVLVLALIALLMMAVTLVLVFASAWRLLPLLAALAGLVVSAGVLRLAGGEFSLAVLGAAPILAGLTVDYAVQVQARLDEFESGIGPVDAARESARLGLPVLALACVATALGFGVLAVSDVPLIGQFGVMLGVGILVCFLVTVPLAYSLLALRGDRRDEVSPAVAIGAVGQVRRRFKPLVALAITAPGRVILIAAVISACGWLAGTQLRSGTEIGQLLPTRSAAVQDLLKVERATGFSGNLDLVVRAPNVLAPEVVEWIGDVRTEVLERAGYQQEEGEPRPNCRVARICPGPAITDFVDADTARSGAGPARAALRGLPLEEREAMLAGGLVGKRPARITNLPFLVRGDTVESQAEAIGIIEDAVAGKGSGEGPPAGVTASLTGLPVVIADQMDSVATQRYLMVALALILIAVVVTVAARSFRRALVPLVPIVIAAGWSSLLIAVLDLPLNPLSAVLSVLVIAIATEFSLILTGRFRQERARGAGLADSLRYSYGRTGLAVATSGLTAIAGFAALAASDIGMVRQFGLIAVLDLAVALAGVALVLPAALVWLERR